MVIVDDMNCIHIYQDESWKEKMDCNDIEDGEDIMVVSAHKNGFIIAGNQGTVIFYDLNDKLYDSCPLLSNICHPVILSIYTSRAGP